MTNDLIAQLLSDAEAFTGDFNSVALPGPLANKRADRLRQAAAHIEALAERVRELEDFVERISWRAAEGPWPDHFADEAPGWARDEYGEGSECGYCGAWLTVVRPGKSQCDHCADGKDIGAIAHGFLSARQARKDKENG
jgi:hypothetical protein